MQSVPVFIDAGAHQRPPSLHMTVIAFFPSAADDPVLYGTPSASPLPASPLALYPSSPSLPWEGATCRDNDETMQTG